VDLWGLAVDMIRRQTQNGSHLAFRLNSSRNLIGLRRHRNPIGLAHPAQPALRPVCPRPLDRVKVDDRPRRSLQRDRESAPSLRKGTEDARSRRLIGDVTIAGQSCDGKR
jgi:hypothetical protein